MFCPRRAGGTFSIDEKVPKKSRLYKLLRQTYKAGLPLQNSASFFDVVYILALKILLRF